MLKATENKKPRAVLYSRVSTDSQDADNQTRILKEWAASRGLEVVGIYQESESAWKAGHQFKLTDLMGDARCRKFDLVLVWALDRVSREGVLAILRTINKLNQFGVKLWSYQEAWTEAPGELGELLYALTAWVARFESNRRSERTKAGLARVKAQGKVLGRPVGSKDKVKRKRRNKQ